jgi:hypothetical protein
MKSLIATFVGLALVYTTGSANQTATSPLFSDDDVLQFRLEAPLQKLFDAKGDEDFSVTGTVSYAGPGGETTLPGVEIAVRGHTSRRDDECTFPKLKLKFPEGEALDRSPFAGSASVKIGTHCGEAPDGQLTPKFGRLANEYSPLREAFVYRLIEISGVPTLKARPARITYIDTSAGAAAPLVRNALILEDDDAARKRLGAAAEIPMQEFGTAADRLSPADTARLAFAEAMIGNFDWCLKFTADDRYRCDAITPLWNVVVLQKKDGPAFALIQDFDLAGMVTGRHPWFDNVYNPAFVASGSAAEVEVLSQVQRTRSLFPRNVLDEARHVFLERKTPLFAVLARTTLDPAGRSQARQYLSAFFDAIATDASFYRRVVARPGVQLYVDADRTSEACRPGDVVPPGTLVNELQRRGSMLQVQLLDVLWHWAPPARCPAVRDGRVWIAADSVSADYPPAAAK